MLHTLEKSQHLILLPNLELLHDLILYSPENNNPQFLLQNLIILNFLNSNILEKPEEYRFDGVIGKFQYDINNFIVERNEGNEYLQYIGIDKNVEYSNFSQSEKQKSLSSLKRFGSSISLKLIQ